MGVAAAIAAAGLWQLIGQPAWHTPGFKHLLKNYGSQSRLLVFFVLAPYVLMFALRKRVTERWKFLKEWTVTLSRFAKRWHTPIALIAIALIALHVTGAFLYGFQLDFHNITGLLALLVLLPVPVAGLLRYRKMDRQWHVRLGLLFAVLFLLHAFF
jgi:cytochrome b561